MTISMKVCDVFAMLFYKNNDCAPNTEGYKKGTNSMTAMGLEKIIQKFKKASSFDVNLVEGGK